MSGWNPFGDELDELARGRGDGALALQGDTQRNAFAGNAAYFFVAGETEQANNFIYKLDRVLGEDA